MFSRLPVDGLRFQSSHINFDLSFALSTRYAGVKVVQKLWGWSMLGYIDTNIDFDVIEI